MGKRHTARRLAMQALFEHSISKLPCQEILKQSVLDSPASLPAKQFAEELARILDLHLEEIDAEIRLVLKEWDFNRLANVDRSIIQLAVCEMMYSKEPPPVVIDEAVELAKEFGEGESPQFVNGVLGAVYRGRYNPEKVT